MQKELKITTLHNGTSDFSYWITKSYTERLETIEFLRQQYIKYNDISEGLQRICRITNKTQG